MNSKGYFRSVLLAFTVSLALTTARLNAQDGHGLKPNIIMIVGDDVGWGDLGVYGGGEGRGIPTPNLDRMADEGITFFSFYGQPSCTPGRAALITGRIPNRSGLTTVSFQGQGGGLPHAEWTLASVLKQADYSTFFAGKWHLGESDYALPNAHGIDVMHLNLHKTFSTPHGGGGPGAGAVAVAKVLTPFLPGPRLKREGDLWKWSYDEPQSIGRVRAYYGNFGVLIRALAYIMAHGGNGLRQATLDALLNANYIRKLLEPYYQIAYMSPSMHECVFSDDRQAAKGVRTGDIAKRLIDYGFHPYTVSFPLIVRGALMIEPTETESKQELDLFVDAMISIANEVEQKPELVRSAPHSTRTSRVDEVTAARKPVVRWKPRPQASQAAD